MQLRPSRLPAPPPVNYLSASCLILIWRTREIAGAKAVRESGGQRHDTTRDSQGVRSPSAPSCVAVPTATPRRVRPQAV